MAQSNEEANKLREELLELNKKRDKIDKEIKDWQAVLQSQKVGMNDPLVDAEGFPRNDIDVYQVRTARNKIICLQNDGKEVMRQIEEKLYKYHELNHPDNESPQR
ncbi:26S proteasome non-ATPase regulatory subunit 9-like protein [Leptotrombidium deliense]|uniref:26S proteasome non-ATPase regulatory subunit 9-like protein n=1 Tax=Leptotrombidium deliense TaxID=299467 RepID=A0A443SDY6_9ACAR|nr:26S proteasome non-ATPase regulatory subunit 9-like protein [Leptotrombidium deliense]